MFMRCTYYIPGPNAIRNFLLTSASLFCSSPKARFVDMFPRRSIVLFLCSLTALPCSPPATSSFASSSEVCEKSGVRAKSDGTNIYGLN